MSRSGYTDGFEMWSVIRWRGAVASAIRGQRGQRLLRDLLAAEIMNENDEGMRFGDSPEGRWCRMRAWVAENLREASGGNARMEAAP